MDLAAVPIAKTPLLQPSTRTPMLLEIPCSNLEISPRSKLVQARVRNTHLLVCRHSAVVSPNRSRATDHAAAPAATMTTIREPSVWPLTQAARHRVNRLLCMQETSGWRWKLSWSRLPMSIRTITTSRLSGGRVRSRAGFSMAIGGLDALQSACFLDLGWTNFNGI
jgi:hypothetical protein